MRVLATVVIPPHLEASGAVNAAIALSSEISKFCEIDIAIMSQETSESRHGDLRVLKRAARCPASFLTHRLPNKVRSLLYRSDLPQLVSSYDLVHIHNPLPTLEMKRIAVACVSQGIPYTLTTHGFVEVLDIQNSYQLGWLGTMAARHLVRKPLDYVIEHAQKICCLAPYDQNLLLEYGVKPEKLTVIPNGVNTDFLVAPSSDALSATRVQFGIGENLDAPVCFFLANHTRNKGLDVLLNGFLASSRPYCLVVGGKKRDYDYAGYSARVREGQRIIFTDKLTESEIHCLHYCADLFVFPSRADTLPLVVLEAMASGRPVLSTFVGGIPYQVDDSCGRLVPPNDPVELRKALDEMIHDLPKLREMGLSAREKVLRQFNWQRSAQLTMDVYREMLAT